MDSARALIARGWGVSLVSRCLRVSRAQLYVILRRTDDWMAAAVVTLMIRMCFSVYTMLSESCPRMVIVGYGRCFADRQNLMVCLRSMPNVFTGSCARMRCCLIDRNLNPKKIKKTPKNGCLFNTACVP